MSKIFSVTEVNNYISNIFVRDGVLRRICIKGEISGCKYNSSGHIYFTLKDESSKLTCVIFRGDRGALDFELKDGLSVVCSGEMNVYTGGGTYSLIVRNIELSGKGDLFAQMEELKKRLSAEGLFDVTTKKNTPFYPTKIGVATAKTGAALQDILNIAWRRNPHVKIYLAPCKVQGEGASASVIKALKRLDEAGLDAIIVGRGGGSYEDLMAFNDESLARTIHAMKTPVVSAVGHEVDFTICDFVADHRAPTPSAAAELVIKEYQSVRGNLVDLHSALLGTFYDKLEDKKNELNNLSRILEYNKPLNQINNKKQRLDNIREHLSDAMHDRLDNIRREIERIKPELDSDINSVLTKRNSVLSVLYAQLDKLSPLKKIASGYGYVSLDGVNLRSVSQVKPQDDISVTVMDGSMLCEVKEIKPNS